MVGLFNPYYTIWLDYKIKETGPFFRNFISWFIENYTILPLERTLQFCLALDLASWACDIFICNSLLLAFVGCTNWQSCTAPRVRSGFKVPPWVFHSIVVLLVPTYHCPWCQVAVVLMFWTEGRAVISFSFWATVVKESHEIVQYLRPQKKVSHELATTMLWVDKS
jgi:hypothetical protein